MRQWLWAGVLGLAVMGCQASNPFQRSASDQELFSAVTMRLHPTFTQVKDWTGDKKLDGIEAVVEMQDQFGEPTRATGRIMFELYGYRIASPDPKGDRIAGPWVAALRTRDEQVAHWNSAIRGYNFQLSFPNAQDDRSYVLTAQFDNGVSRLFDQLVIEGKNKVTKRREHQTVHATPQSPTH